jgi:N-acyl-D-aspartate/D-glutamate deacylase
MPNGITRKGFIKTAALSGASLLFTGVRGSAFEVQRPPLDVLIRGGRVVDGSGKAAFLASVGIRDGRIADIGQIPETSARTVIDATGQYVCPGFIDPHAHEEILMVADPVLEKFVRQGVTTLINGNCGHSVTPYRAKTVLEYFYREALISHKRSQMRIDWEGVDGYAKAIGKIGATINSAVLLGYGGIRWAAMRAGGSHDRPPTAAEWKEIERLVNTGCEQGAVGMSTGLAYRPCYYATTDELVRVAKILTKHDVTYASHVRPGRADAGTLSGGPEAVAIGERAGCRVQISHFGGRSQASLDLVTNANARGLTVLADVIPQSLSHRRASDRMLEALMVFYPGAFDYSRQQLRDLLLSDKRAEILKSVQFFSNNKEQVVIVRALTPKHRDNVSKSVAQIARELNKSADDVYVDLILDEAHPVVFTFDGNRREGRGERGRGDGIPGETRTPDGRGRGEGIAVESRAAEGRGRGAADAALPLGTWTKHPQFGPGSDSLPVDMDEPYGWFEHQRRGAFVGYFRQAKENGVTLEEAVRKATSMPAAQFRLKDRGTLDKGRVGDVMVFDPDKYSFPSPAESDPNDPHPMASGVSTVIVNGTIVLQNGSLTGKKPGKVIL